MLDLPIAVAIRVSEPAGALFALPARLSRYPGRSMATSRFETAHNSRSRAAIAAAKGLGIG